MALTDEDTQWLDEQLKQLTTSFGSLLLARFERLWCKVGYGVSGCHNNVV